MIQFLKGNLILILICAVLVGVTVYLFCLQKNDPEPQTINIEKVIDSIIDKVKE